MFVHGLVAHSHLKPRACASVACQQNVLPTVVKRLELFEKTNDERLKATESTVNSFFKGAVDELKASDRRRTRAAKAWRQTPAANTGGCGCGCSCAHAHTTRRPRSPR